MFYKYHIMYLRTKVKIWLILIIFISFITLTPNWNIFMFVIDKIYRNGSV